MEIGRLFELPQFTPFYNIHWGSSEWALSPPPPPPNHLYHIALAVVEEVIGC